MRGSSRDQSTTWTHNQEVRNAPTQIGHYSHRDRDVGAPLHHMPRDETSRSPPRRSRSRPPHRDDLPYAAHMDVDDDPDERYFHKMGHSSPHNPDDYDRERTMEYPTDTKQFPGQNPNWTREKPKSKPKHTSVRFGDRTPSQDSHRGVNIYQSKNIENFMDKKPRTARTTRTPSHDSHHGVNIYQSKNIENFMDKKPKMHGNTQSGSKRHELKQLSDLLKNEIAKQKLMEEEIDRIGTAEKRRGGRPDFVNNLDGDSSIAGIGGGVSPIRTSRGYGQSRDRDMDRDGERLEHQHSQPRRLSRQHSQPQRLSRQQGQPQN